MPERGPMTEDEIITLIAREWLTEKGVSEEAAAELSSPEEFPLVVPEDWAACRAIAQAVLHRVATALAEARAEGKRQGLEEAAKEAETHSYAPGTETFVVNGQTLKSRNGEDQFVGVGVLRAGIRALAASIRSLATSTETQKPEETP